MIENIIIFLIVLLITLIMSAGFIWSIWLIIKLIKSFPNSQRQIRYRNSGPRRKNTSFNHDFQWDDWDDDQNLRFQEQNQMFQEQIERDMANTQDFMQTQMDTMDMNNQMDFNNDFGNSCDFYNDFGCGFDNF